MTVIHAQIKHDTQYPDHEKWAREALRHQMIQALGELTFSNREGIICIAPLKESESHEFDYRPSSTIRLEAEYQFAHKYPVILYEGYSYQNMVVIPPHELK
jgi:hypothetical protein